MFSENTILHLDFSLETIELETVVGNYLRYTPRLILSRIMAANLLTTAGYDTLRGTLVT